MLEPTCSGSVDVSLQALCVCLIAFLDVALTVSPCTAALLARPSLYSSLSGWLLYLVFNPTFIYGV